MLMSTTKSKFKESVNLMLLHHRVHLEIFKISKLNISFTLHQDQSCHHNLLLGMQALSTFSIHKNQRNVMICLMSHSRKQESNPVVWPLDIQSPS